MSWTRRQFITTAYEEIGLASYVYDLEPEQLLSAKTRLDSMMATWNGKGIRCGYPLVNNPDLGDLDDDTGVADMDAEAIYSNLAIRLANKHGKKIPRELKVTAKSGYNALLTRKVADTTRKLNPSLVPAGQGHRVRGIGNRTYLNKPSTALDAGGDSELDL